MPKQKNKNVMLNLFQYLTNYELCTGRNGCKIPKQVRDDRIGIRQVVEGKVNSDNVGILDCHAHLRFVSWICSTLREFHQWCYSHQLVQSLRYPDSCTHVHSVRPQIRLAMTHHFFKGHLAGLNYPSPEFAPLNRPTATFSRKGRRKDNILILTLKGRGKRKVAFTLAEVLITLAIIGVVAAMTLPVLINKYQDRVNEMRYKKAISMVSQAMQLAMAKDETVGNMTHTDIWGCASASSPEDCYHAETKHLFKNIALSGESLKEKMEAIDYGNIRNPWGDVVYGFITGDGYAFGYTDGLTLIVDTNSSSKPNKL